MCVYVNRYILFIKESLVWANIESNLSPFTIDYFFTTHGHDILITLHILIISFLAPVPKLSGLRVVVINGTTAVARWNPITKEHVVGNLLGYNCRLYKHDYSKISHFKTNKTAIVFKDLQPGCVYGLIVNGYTSDYTGGSSYYDFIGKYMSLQ